jgi:putative hydrolase of the HAD superfamily
VIRAVIFDFGRVVSAPKPPSLFHRYEMELGLAPDTINAVMFDSPHWQDALVGKTDMDGYWHAVGPALGLHTPEAVAAFRNRYYADERINTGVVRMIRRLSAAHSLAILSNHPPGLRQWLEDWKLADRFDVVFCSGNEGVAKPDPRAFRETLRRLNVSAGEAVFVDDTLEHVAAARELGIHAVHYTTTDALRRELEVLGCL